MLCVVGTVPDEKFPLTSGQARVIGDKVEIGGMSAPVNRGTPALLAAALKVGEVMGGPKVFAYLAGDIGLGGGSRELYKHLKHNLSDMSFGAMVFHYLQPDVDWHNQVLWASREMRPKPLLIADAGFMYAAKMSGQAGRYDLFTPDMGELAFLADESAPHPFYTRGFILHEGNKAPDLINRAYEHGNAARHLLVKGKRDYFSSGAGRLEPLDGPDSPAMEAVGGTGDTLTGMVSALTAYGLSVPRSAKAAALANRLAAGLADPTPATQVLDIIEQIPEALEQALKQIGES